MKAAEDLAKSLRPKDTKDMPNMLFLEWTDPPFDGPHTPELVDMANARCSKVCTLSKFILIRFFDESGKF